MKRLVLLSLLLFPIFLFAQYPTFSNKQRLGVQTTGDGLIYRGDLEIPNYQPSNVNNAYFYLDTVRNTLKFYKGGWIQIYPAPQFDTTTLNVYLKISDTTAMLLPYFRDSDTTQLKLISRFALKLNISDTSVMLSPYLRKADTISLSNRINLKLNISDTTILSNRITTNANNIITINTKLNTKLDTIYVKYKNVVTRLLNKDTIDVLSDGYAINIIGDSINVDTTLLDIRYPDRDSTNELQTMTFATTSGVIVIPGGKVMNLDTLYNSVIDSVKNLIQDSIAAFIPVTEGYGINIIGDSINVDTTIIFTQSDTITLSNRINLKLNKSDTISLSNRINTKLNISDTINLSNRIDLKLNKSDTVSLSNRINLKLDTIYAQYPTYLDTITNKETITIPKDLTEGFGINIIADSINIDSAVILNTQQKQIAYIKNQSGVTMYKGQAVYSSGSTGNNKLVQLASSNTEQTSSKTFGVVESDSIPNGIHGYIITFGVLSGFNTNGLTEGNSVYLSSTPGQLTTTKPQAPLNLVTIGICIRQQQTNGSIFVKIQNGFKFDELHDVILTDLVNKASLYYNSSESLWRDTTATLLVSDTASMLNTYLRKLDTITLSNRINLKFNTADTTQLNLTSRFATKLNYTDTSFLFTQSDTNQLNLTSRFLTKLNISDTLSMLSKYLRKLDTVSISNRINLKVNISDTATMLLPYFRDIDTTSLNLSSRFNTKINISDTTNMLLPYLRKADTTSMLLPYFRDADTSLLNLTNRFNTKLNLSDTANMLANYNTRINFKLNIADTINMLSPYLRKADTSNLSYVNTYSNQININGDKTFNNVVTIDSATVTGKLLVNTNINDAVKINSNTNSTNLELMNSGGSVFIKSSNKNMTLQTDTTALVYLKGDVNRVGILTMNPEQALEVAGTIRVDSLDNNLTPVKLVGSNSSNDLTDVKLGTGLSISNDTLKIADDIINSGDTATLLRQDFLGINTNVLVWTQGNKKLLPYFTQVYRNGQLLKSESQYTVTSDSIITLAVGSFKLDDNITVIAIDNIIALAGGGGIITLQGDVTGSGTNTITTTIGISKVTNTMLAGGISNNKLDIITTAGKVSNSATTATNSNTNNAIVSRDGSGNFIASTITANLSGNASTATTLATGRTLAITGDLTYTSPSFNGSTNVTAAGTLANSGVTANTYTAATITVDAKGRITSASNNTIPTVNNGNLIMNVSGNGLTGSRRFSANQSTDSTFTVTSNAINTNTPSTIVFRDASGDFSSRNITASNFYGLASIATMANTIQSSTTTGAIRLATLNNAVTPTITVPDVNATMAITNAAQTFTGIQTFNSQIVGSISGNAATATNVAYSGLTGTVPTWNQNTTGNAATVTTNANLNGDITSVGNTTTIGSGVIVNADINASAAIDVSKLSASTISGVTLGNNLNTLTISSPLTGTSYNGSSAISIGLQAATTLVDGSMSATDKTKLDGIAAGAQVNVPTNLAQGTRTTTTVPITSSTGTSATLDIATTSLAGVMSSSDKTKLDGIASGATANTGTVTSVSALTLTTTGSDLTSSVATGTTTPVITLNVPNASVINRGVLTSTDWNTFNGKQNALGNASASVNGILTSTDWTTFNNKQAALVSGTTIKTVNGTTLLGSGNLSVGTLIGTDTVSLSNKINLKVNISDTAAMLTNYRNALNTKLNISDTSSMLLPYLRKNDTTSLNLTSRFASKQNTISLTTTGTSGASTFNGTTLNVPNYTLSGLGGLSNSITSTQDGYFGNISLYDDNTPSNYLNITNSANLTAARTLSINVNDVDRTVSLSGNLTVSNAATISGTNTGDQTITLTGDVTGTGTGSFATTLANSGVTANTYRSVTVDSKGRVTAGTNPTTLAGYGITNAVDTSRTITINGTAFNLSANRSYSVGTVTSISGTGTVSGLSLTGTVNTTGNLTLGGTLAVTPSNFASQTANTILASPNGSAGVPTFRTLVAADIPTLNQNTTGTSSGVTGTVNVINGGTGLTTIAAKSLIVANNTNAYTALTPNAGQSIRVNSGNTAWESYTPSVGTLIGTDTVSLSNKINLKVNISDTSTMLLPYLKKVDTTAMLLPYFRDNDTTLLNLSSRFAAKLNISDTASMLTPYFRDNDTTSLNLTSRFLTKLNISDTTNMLLPYLRKADTSLLNLTSRLNTKLNILDTTNMLSSYLRKADTTNMLLPYFKDADTSLLNLTNRFNTKLNILDTLNMLSKYLRRADTTLMLLPYLRKADTTSMLLPYFKDADTSILNLTSRLNTKLNISDTTNMLLPYLRKADTTIMLLPYFKKSDTTQLNLTSRFASKLNYTDTSFLFTQSDTNQLNLTSRFAAKQNILNGTGFVKASGTNITYDNSSYLTTSLAASTYLPLTGGTLSGNLRLSSSNATQLNIDANDNNLESRITFSTTGSARSKIYTTSSVSSMTFESIAQASARRGFRFISSTEGTQYLGLVQDPQGNVGIKSDATGNDVHPNTLYVNGTLGVSGAATLSSTLAVTGITTLSNTLNGINQALSSNLTISDIIPGNSAPIFTTVQTGPSSTSTVIFGLNQSLSGEANMFMGGTQGLGGNPTNPNIYFTDSRRAYASIGGIHTSGGSNNQSGHIVFNTTPSLNTVALTERMRIAQDGSITMGGTLGVTGATTLLSTLAVQGDITEAGNNVLTNLDTASLSSRIDGKVSLTATETIGGTKTFNNLVNITNQMTLSGSVEGLNKLIGKNSSNNYLGDITLGSGLSITSNVLNVNERFYFDLGIVAGAADNSNATYDFTYGSNILVIPTSLNGYCIDSVYIRAVGCSTCPPVVGDKDYYVGVYKASAGNRIATSGATLVGSQITMNEYDLNEVNRNDTLTTGDVWWVYLNGTYTSDMAYITAGFLVKKTCN